MEKDPCMNCMNQCGREIYLDKLRVTATCAVVMLHTITGVADHVDMGLYTGENRLFLTIMDLVCWGVPVFLLISGYLFLNPDRSITIKEMVFKYIRRIVLALFLFGVPYACAELYMVRGGFAPDMLLQSVMMVLTGKSWSHMWYLYLILLLYLMTPALKWILGRIPLIAVYLVLALLFVGGSVIPFLGLFLEEIQLPGLPAFATYLFYYLCGYGFQRQKKRMENGHGRRLFCMLSITGIVLSVACILVIRISGCELRFAYHYLPVAVLSLSVFGVAYFIGGHCRVKGTVDPAGRTGEENTEPGSRPAGGWERAGRLCFGIYLIHPVFLNLSYKYFGVTPLDFPVAVSLPVFFLGTLVLSAITARILYQIPFFKKYVL